MTISKELLVSKEELRRDLACKTLSITFIKKDGTERVMKCTLSPSLLPEIVRVEKIDESGKVIVKARKINEDIQNVYDLDNNAWKSFRLDSITNVETVI